MDGKEINLSTLSDAQLVAIYVALDGLDGWSNGYVEYTEEFVDEVDEVANAVEIELDRRGVDANIYYNT